VVEIINPSPKIPATGNEITLPGEPSVKLFVSSFISLKNLIALVWSYYMYSRQIGEKEQTRENHHLKSFRYCIIVTVYF